MQSFIWTIPCAALVLGCGGGNSDISPANTGGGAAGASPNSGAGTSSSSGGNTSAAGSSTGGSGGAAATNNDGSGGTVMSGTGPRTCGKAMDQSALVPGTWKNLSPADLKL